MKNLLILCGLGLSVVHAAAAGLADCRAIADAQARLACYDGLPITAAVPVPTVTPPAAAPAAQPATKEPASGWFGLTRRDPDADKAITSTIPGHFSGWQAGTRFKLANGQVWRISDDSSAFYQLNDVKVSITPGAFGSYYLKIEGVNDSPHVRRVE